MKDIFYPKPVELKFLREQKDKPSLSRIRIFAQNINTNPKGEMLSGGFSGQESYLEISRVGAEGSLIGHSEIRQHFGETDSEVRSKFLGLIKHGLTPIVCIGEAYSDRYGSAGQENEQQATGFITKQIEDVFGNLDSETVRAAIVAYEPRWAIGTGKSATSTQVERVHCKIRQKFVEMYGLDIAQTIRILYGGSANIKNVEELFSIPDVDGFLVGTASANENEFLQMGQVMTQRTENLSTSTPFNTSFKKGRLPILAGNLKIIRRDYESSVADKYTELKSLDRRNLQVIIAPPNTLLQEFSKTL